MMLQLMARVVGGDVARCEETFAETNNNKQAHVVQQRTPGFIVSGSFGQIWMTCDGNIIKRVSGKFIPDALREFAFLKRLNHENIIKAMHCDIKENSVNIFLEYGGQDLIERTPSRNECSNVFCQVLKGMTYMHSMCIAHRDLKMDNIVRDTCGHVRVIDFGLACYVPREKFGYKVSRDKAGSQQYACPEMWQTPYDPFAADVWSLGIVLYALMFHRLPFTVSRLEDPHFRHFTDTSELPNHHKVSGGEFEDLLYSMLCIDVDKRIRLIEPLSRAV